MNRLQESYGSIESNSPPELECDRFIARTSSECSIHRERSKAIRRGNRRAESFRRKTMFENVWKQPHSGQGAAQSVCLCKIWRLSNELFEALEAHRVLIEFFEFCWRNSTFQNFASSSCREQHCSIAVHTVIQHDDVHTVHNGVLAVKTFTSSHDAAHELRWTPCASCTVRARASYRSANLQAYQERRGISFLNENLLNLWTCRYGEREEKKKLLNLKNFADIKFKFINFIKT